MRGKSFGAQALIIVSACVLVIEVIIEVGPKKFGCM